MSTKVVASLGAPAAESKAEGPLKRFAPRKPKTPVDPRNVALDTLRRYPKTMARLAE